MHKQKQMCTLSAAKMSRNNAPPSPPPERDRFDVRMFYFRMPVDTH